MKKKKIIISAVVAAAAVSVCSASLIMLNTKASDTNHLTDEQKSSMIEERKEEKRKYGGMTPEEKLKVKGDYDTLKNIEDAKAIDMATEEGREFQKYSEKMHAIDEQEEKERNAAVYGMLSKAGYYPDGFDRERFVKDEDYYLDCISDVCRCYSEQKEFLSQDEKEKVERYIDIAYNDIIYWYPQSEKSTETYELIEETLDMDSVCRIETEQPLVYKYLNP